MPFGMLKLLVPFCLRFPIPIKNASFYGLLKDRVFYIWSFLIHHFFQIVASDRMFAFYRSASFFFPTWLPLSFLSYFPFSLFSSLFFSAYVRWIHRLYRSASVDEQPKLEDMRSGDMLIERVLRSRHAFFPLVLSCAFPRRSCFFFVSLYYPLFRPFFYYPHVMISRVWDAANRIYSKQSVYSVRQS